MKQARAVLGVLLFALLLIPSASAGATNPPQYTGELTISACYNQTNGQVRIVKPWGPDPECVPPDQCVGCANRCTEGGQFDCKPNEFFIELNTKGPKGDKGDPGPKGDMGPAGLKGDTGVPGESVISIKLEPGDPVCPFGGTQFSGISGTTYACNGAPGAKGDQGPKGDTGDQGPQGIQGLKGDKGDQGIQGDKGDPGTPGTPGAGAVVTALPAGDAHCPNGGARITDGYVGIAYVCSGGGAPPALCAGNGVPGGTCSVTKSTACAYDKNCPSGETCGAPSPRFVNNGDGTVTDMRTCLVWEKKTGTVGVLGDSILCSSATDCPNPHDVNNRYTWSTGSSLWNFDGTAATLFLAQLNGAAFAGHTDWRLPTSAGSMGQPTGQDPELESILFAPYPCGPSPCIDSLFGPTAAYPYWSSSTLAAIPPHAWYVWFVNGHVDYLNFKSEGLYVRAVRGGP